jgi:hypothetical protein
MATWSKKVFLSGQESQWAPLQNEFERHYMRVMPRRDMVGDRREMMLLISSLGGEDTLYMALPSGEKMYEGFAPAQFAEIPENPGLLVGDQIGYEELFVRRK